MADPTADLAAHKFLALTTFKRDGDGTSTPMWVARDGGALVMWTPADSVKVKRLRRDARVSMVPCSRTGKVDAGARPVEGTAEVIDDAAVTASVEKALRSKYGLQYRIVTTLEKIIARGAKPRVVLKISPTG